MTNAIAVVNETEIDAAHVPPSTGIVEDAAETVGRGVFQSNAVYVFPGITGKQPVMKLYKCYDISMRPQ